LERDYLRDRACKASIRAGHRLTNQEIEILLQDLSACDEPTRCPHGRPVLVGMGEVELDRLFKRIV
jgi:DNA mismatch repair protein MutL